MQPTLHTNPTLLIPSLTSLDCGISALKQESEKDGLKQGHAQVTVNSLHGIPLSVLTSPTLTDIG
jgi:hypothetical protein